ncbi:MAG: hypothetical protein HY904_20270 [Deltaproteobacteria bacterium]|nr:hypothetical protein [Deltaproteobacteria bacterium]
MNQPLCSRAPVLFFVCLLAACTGGKDKVPEVVPAGCNPLAYAWDCLLPYPSDHFLVDDATLPTGKRVAVPLETSFHKDDGAAVDFFALHPADGFSHVPAMVVVFPVALSTANLHAYDGDYAASTDPGSATLLLDAETHAPILHVSELDANSTVPGKQALVLRPLVRLQNRHRYVVALRNLQDTAGQAAPVPEGFRRIRDGATADSPALQAEAARLNAGVFPVLEAFGVQRSSLTLAWDFTTGSLEHLTRDMVDAREQLVAALEVRPPPVTIISVCDDDNTHIWRRIEAQMEVPSFMESQDLGAFLNRGADGRVAPNGVARVAFTVLIPYSVRDNTQYRPARVVQYGHGFFGSRGEMSGSFLTQFLATTGMVGVGVDWWGMSVADVAVVAEDLLNVMDQTFRFTERVTQGMMNQIALEYVTRDVLPTLAELQVGGQPITDGQQAYWYGNSQGHILGGTFLALSTHINRGVLGVGGMGIFSVIAPRARPFIDYLALIKQHVTDPLEHQKLLSLGQSGFDRIDPATYAPLVRDNTLPGGPAKRRILMQTGLGDTQVPSIAAEAHARALGLVHLVPGPKTLPGMETSTGPVDDSAYVQFDFHVAEPLPGARPEFPSGDNEVHEGVRRAAAGRQQVDGFFRPDGVIVNHCDGPCDPE